MHPFAKTHSASDRLEQCLDAIRRWDHRLHAMTTVDEPGARSAAAAADRAAADGRSLGLLHGIPIVVKDNIDTAGLRTTYGSLYFANHVPTADAAVVEHLRQAGAVIVGKSTLHEFAFGTRSTSPVVGQCRNPWDESRIPGGSSGGSAVALATGMCDMALGSDTGASIRLPAALTGVCGLRPTVGRVSSRGTFPVSPLSDVVGPMACTVEEVALLFAVIAGYDPRDPHSEQQELPNFLPALNSGIAGMRIGRPRNHYFEDVSSPVGTALEAALRTLSDLGALIVDIDVPDAEQIPDAHSVILGCDARDVHADRLGSNDTLWDPQTLERMQRGARYSGADYAHAMRIRERWSLTLRQVFATVDLIVSPTTPTVAPPVDDSRSLFESTRALTKNNVVGSFAQIPGLSVPCGFSPEGLPIGIQFEAARWNEPLILRAGYAFQSATDWQRHPPLPAID